MRLRYASCLVSSIQCRFSFQMLAIVTVGWHWTRGGHFWCKMRNDWNHCHETGMALEVGRCIQQVEQWSQDGGHWRRAPFMNISCRRRQAKLMVIKSHHSSSPIHRKGDWDAGDAFVHTHTHTHRNRNLHSQKWNFWWGSFRALPSIYKVPRLIIRYFLDDTAIVSIIFSISLIFNRGGGNPPLNLNTEWGIRRLFIHFVCFNLILIEFFWGIFFLLGRFRWRVVNRRTNLQAESLRQRNADH